MSDRRRRLAGADQKYEFAHARDNAELRA